MKEKFKNVSIDEAARRDLEGNVDFVCSLHNKHGMDTKIGEARGKEEKKRRRKKTKRNKKKRLVK